MIVIGSDCEKAGRLAGEIYKDIEAPLENVSIEVAELIKYVNNSWHFRQPWRSDAAEPEWTNYLRQDISSQPEVCELESRGTREVSGSEQDGLPRFDEI